MNQKQVYKLMLAGLIGNLCTFYILNTTKKAMGPIDYLEVVWIITVMVWFMMEVAKPVWTLFKMFVDITIDEIKERIK